jgi:hypothetical protein
LRYKPHPDGEVWFALERGADAAKFSIFTKEKPSRRYAETIEQYRMLDGDPSPDAALRDFLQLRRLDAHGEEIRRLIGQTAARIVLDHAAGKQRHYAPARKMKSFAAWPGVEIACADAMVADIAKPANRMFDGVFSVDALQHMPEEDIGWILDEMFAAAKSFVYVGVSSAETTRKLPNGASTPCNAQPAEWWQGQLELAAKRQPGRRWRLVVTGNDNSLKTSRSFAGGGAMASAA